MKKTYLKFPTRPVSYLPKIRSRRMQLGLSNHNRAYKSEGPEAPTKEDPLTEEQAIAEIGKQVESFKTILGDKADKAQFDTLEKQLKDLQAGIKDMEAAKILESITAINKANASIHSQIAEMQEKALEAKEAEKGATGPKAKFVTRKQVEDFVKETFGSTVKGEQKDKSRNETSIELNTNKAAEDFSYATFFEGGASTDISAFTGRVIDPELYQRRRKTNIILDYFDIRTISVPILVYLIKVEDGDDEDSLSGDSGSAAWIECGAEKPKRSFRVTSAEVKAKKIAIFGTIDDCLLQDVPSLERWVREDFTDEMREGINSGLLSNNPSVNDEAPQGLTYAAKQFSVSPAFADKFATNTSNYIDQLIAVFASMRYSREEAAMAFVSSDVWYMIHALKDTNERYQNQNLVYTDTLGRIYIAGVLVVPVDQDDVPSTHLLVIGKDLGFKIFAYGPMVFERGWNMDDFRKDKTSYRGYQRFLSYIPSHRENSVIYDTFANVKAAIEA
jgi:HK97 family phage major capsid protein